MNNDKRYQLYEDFQKRFPLEKLPEMTLEEYTNLERKDSFCYWIESKTNSLGSFWGGSSFKFGIYRYKDRPNSRKIIADDKYAWYKFFGANSAEEAFALVKDTIIRIANAARSGNLAEIDRIKVLGTAYKWKIAFLYSDMKLLPIYKLEYLRIAAQLEGLKDADKLEPAMIQWALYEKRDNRPVMEYYDELIHKVLKIVRIKRKTLNEAEVLGEVIFETTAVHEPENISKQYWWLVANPKYWSFSNLKDGQTVEYTVKNGNGNKRRIPANFEQARIGDIVIGYEATPVKSIVAIAEVVKASDGETISFKKVETLASPIPWTEFKDLVELADMEFIKNPNGSFFRLTEDECDLLMDIIRRDNPEDDNPVVKKSVTKTYGKEDFLNEVYVKESDYHRLSDLLLQKKNVILQGAPGVGKTFTAKRLAYAMMGEIDPARVQVVQFHQNYSYEDFIMGYKPGASGFELHTGVFYDFCKRAAADDPERKYFFIIDEINRGNLSKIFGELLQLIEKSYRNQHIQLAYRKEDFAVPGNVYIIGMMNTADRSLAMIDYALRRRFSFFKMTPGFDTEGFKAEIAKHSDERIPKVVEAVRRLNETIMNDDSLGEGFCIGHSYFCEHDPETDWIESVVYHDICPMLEEYWFDNKEKYKAETNRLLETLKK